MTVNDVYELQLCKSNKSVTVESLIKKRKFKVDTVYFHKKFENVKALVYTRYTNRKLCYFSFIPTYTV